MTPKVTFSSFVTSLYASTMQYLGDSSSPPDAEKLIMAKQTIDLLEVLEAKTRGNLDEEESRLMAQLLHDLRLRFVSAKKTKMNS